MSKNIYIGDIHGRDIWEQIVEEHKDANNIVFIGDYFDSFDIPGVVQLKNAQEIIEFKKEQELDPTKKVYLLIGNHDIHYMRGIKGKGGTSGFQSNMMYQFEEFFEDNKEHFQMCVQIGDRLCTHAVLVKHSLKTQGIGLMIMKTTGKLESLLMTYFNSNQTNLHLKDMIIDIMV